MKRKKSVQQFQSPMHDTEPVSKPHHPPQCTLFLPTSSTGTGFSKSRSGDIFSWEQGENGREKWRNSDKAQSGNGKTQEADGWETPFGNTEFRIAEKEKASLCFCFVFSFLFVLFVLFRFVVASNAGTSTAMAGFFASAELKIATE